jgi:hypothetical protein
VEVTDTGVPVDELVAVIKNSIKRAGISRTSATQDLQITSINLVLKVIATKKLGGGLELCVPFIGMKLSANAKVTEENIHTIDMSLVPRDKPAGREVRGGEIERVLVNAITTIRETMASAAKGDDPWVLSKGKVDISYGITRSGNISLGVDASATSESTNVLRLDLRTA